MMLAKEIVAAGPPNRYKSTSHLQEEYDQGRRDPWGQGTCDLPS